MNHQRKRKWSVSQKYKILLRHQALVIEDKGTINPPITCLWVFLNMWVIVLLNWVLYDLMLLLSQIVNSFQIWVFS